MKTPDIIKNINIPLSAESRIPYIDRFVMRCRLLMDMLLLPIDNFYDIFCFLTNCRLSPFVSASARKGYDLIFFSHTIEKGLSLENPRPLFGKKTIARILHLLRISDKDQFDEVAVNMGLGCIRSYLEYHSGAKIFDPFLQELEKQYIPLTLKFGLRGEGGSRNINDIKTKLHEKAYDYKGFLLSRYSCRTFDPTPLSEEIIETIVSIAQNAPSQCNRQSSQIHCFQDKRILKQLLLIQGGCRTFIDEVSTLFVITNDLICWDVRGGRNAGYVDAGMYAMSLLYACHAKGVGGCPLSFAKTSRTERKFKKLANIPPNERVVILLAVGFPCNKAQLSARSKRRNTHSVLRVHS